jgi:hypothetical protein
MSGLPLANVSLRRFVQRCARGSVVSQKSVKTLQAALSVCLTLTASSGLKAEAAPINLDLNRPLQIGWYSLRVQNPFGTNYTGITAIKSFNPATKDFVFLDKDGKEVVINESDISFIYFRQLPDRSDINVKDGPIRNIQITPYKEFLYEIGPGRLSIQDGTLSMNSRWRIATQTPFGVQTTAPPPEGGTAEQTEIPRRIQIGYLGNRYLVETEFVNLLIHAAPQPGAGTVPVPLSSPFKNPPPSVLPSR